MPSSASSAAAVAIDRTRLSSSATDPTASDYFPPIDALVVLLGDPSRPCVGKLNSSWNPEDLATQDRLLNILRAHWLETTVSEATDDSLPAVRPRRLYILTSHDSLVTDISAVAAAERARSASLFVFNLCDEGFSNDALRELHVPALLEVLGVPYSGAGPACLAFCYDKGLVNAAASRLGVPTAREANYLSTLSTSTASSCIRDELQARVKEQGLTYPVFIKPMRGDNSLGITPRSLVNSPDELHAYVSELAAQQLGDVLMQEYLNGNEYSVAVIGNAAATALATPAGKAGSPGYLFFPTLRVDYTQLPPGSVPILGFESKWDPTSVYWTHINHVHADDLQDDTLSALYARCVLLFERFGCRDYARFDFRASGSGVITLLEVNPNPGWCWDGKMAKMAAMGGLGYGDMIALILRTAWKRALEEQATGEASATLTTKGKVGGPTTDSGKIIPVHSNNTATSKRLTLGLLEYRPS